MNLTGLMSKPEKDTSKKTFIRTCKLCGRDFIAPTNNTMRCPECRKVMRQQQSAASYKRFLTKMEMRKMREKTTQGGVTAEKKKDGVPISYWSAALNMLAWKAGLSYGKIQVWAQFHPEEYGKWMHELRLSYEKAAEDAAAACGSREAALAALITSIFRHRGGSTWAALFFAEKVLQFCAKSLD